MGNKATRGPPAQAAATTAASASAKTQPRVATQTEAVKPPPEPTLQVPDAKVVAEFQAVAESYRQKVAAAHGKLHNRPRETPDRPLPRDRNLRTAPITDPDKELGRLTPSQVRQLFERRRDGMGSFDVANEAAEMGLSESALSNILRWNNSYVVVPIDNEKTMGYWHVPSLSDSQIAEMKRVENEYLAAKAEKERKEAEAVGVAKTSA